MFGDGGGSSDTSSSDTSGAGGAGGCLFDCAETTTVGVGGGNPQGFIIVSPQNVQLVVDNGVPQTQAMTAVLNGNDVTSNVTWIYDRPDVGDIAGGSVFTPTGLVGGTGTLTAQYNGAQGQTSIAVTIRKTVDTVGVTPEQVAILDNPQGGPDPALQIVYPSNETVFPLGVLAPEIMWNGGGVGEIYRLTMREKYYEYTEYFTASAPFRHLVSETDWTNVGSSGSGSLSDPLEVKLQRFVGGSAYQPVQHLWHIAQGRLKGSVYYWELPDACGNGNGRILRIKPDSSVVDQPYPSADCYGCHTVSRDGKSMFASFSTGFPFPMQTIDLTTNPAQLGAIQQWAGVTGTFSAFNETGTKLLISNDSASSPAGSAMNIIDAQSGQVLVPSAMGVGCGEPAWSPDGKKIAGICGLGGSGWIFDASSGNLTVADIDASGTLISNQLSIVSSFDGQSGRPAYPTFSPGSEWIAFGRPTSGSRSTGNGTLWLVAPDGSGLKRLLNADSDDRSFNPVFAPLRAGGYFWLVYITRRDYGNRLVGANRQQLWITAIDDPPLAGDPSHPPFYIRGQEDCGKSENAYYALDPCKEIGESCTSGVDCCNGQCVKDPNTNEYVCGDPPDPGECSQDGNSCETSADCCNAPESKCIDGFCQKPPPT
jgi:hypothetical protein